MMTDNDILFGQYSFSNQYTSDVNVLLGVLHRVDCPMTWMQWRHNVVWELDEILQPFIGEELAVAHGRWCTVCQSA